MNAIKRSSGKKKRASYHFGDLVGAIRRTAFSYIATRGTAEFTMRELASDIGVTHGAMYGHYKSKKALLEDLALFGIRELHDAQTASLAGSQHGLDKLKRLAVAYVDFARARPGAYRLIFHVNNP